MLGGLDNQDMSFISDQNILEHVEKLNMSKRTSRIKKLFPNVDSNLLELLLGMLEFNPYLRITAAEAMKNKVFDQIRRPFFEQPCNSVLDHQLEDLDQYDYVELDGQLSISDFKTILLKDAEYIKKKSQLVNYEKKNVEMKNKDENSK